MSFDMQFPSAKLRFLRYTATLYITYRTVAGVYFYPGRCFHLQKPENGAALNNFTNMTHHTMDKVKIAKVTLENFYNNLVIEYEERQHRWEAM